MSLGICHIPCLSSVFLSAGFILKHSLHFGRQGLAPLSSSNLHPIFSHPTEKEYLFYSCSRLGHMFIPERVTVVVGWDTLVGQVSAYLPSFGQGPHFNLVGRDDSPKTNQGLGASAEQATPKSFPWSLRPYKVWPCYLSKLIP